MQIDSADEAVLSDTPMPNDTVAPAGEPGDAPAGPGSEGGSSLGETLRRERLRRNCTLDEMSRAARVPVRYLEALEEEDFTDLPPRIYVRGYLDALARKLSLSAEDVHRLHDDALHEQSRMAREQRAIFGLFRPQGERLHWRDWMVPLLLCVAAGSFLAGKSFVAGEEDFTEPPLSPPPALAGSGEIPRPEEGPPREIPLPGADVPPGGVSVLVRGEATTWVSAESDGGGVEEFAVRAGESLELKAREKIILSLGNAGAVRLVYNGREIGFIGHKGEVKRNLLFTPSEQ